MKKRPFICIGITLFLLSGCQMDSEEDIIKDVEAQQHQKYDQSLIKPSNIERNNELHSNHSLLSTYSNSAGNYIGETANLLERLAPFFEQETVTNDDITSMRATIQTIREQSKQFVDQQRPKPFDGFHHVHLSTLLELDKLDRTLEEMREPINSAQIINAKIYYEGAVMSHKLMEREYLSLSEEYGLY